MDSEKTKGSLERKKQFKGDGCLLGWRGNPSLVPKDKMRNCYLSLRREGGLRHPTQFPEAQLGHIENIVIFVLEGPLRPLLEEGGRAKFMRRKRTNER